MLIICIVFCIHICKYFMLPIIKWAGGKRWLTPTIQNVWNIKKYDRIVEPFCGGMAISLGIEPVNALVNDVNPYLINLYRWIQRGLIIDLDFVNESDYYYERRQDFNNLIQSGDIESKKLAELFLYLNKYGFNGLCRFNNKGLYNVPFGKYTKLNIPKDLTHYSTLITNWTLCCGDFYMLTSHICNNDLLYVDPPYDVQFTKYSQVDFKWDDQMRLAKWLEKLPCDVIASNQATPRVIDLYTSLGFRIEFIDAPRRISCTGDRTAAKEILAYNF